MDHIRFLRYRKPDPGATPPGVPESDLSDLKALVPGEIYIAQANKDKTWAVRFSPKEYLHYTTQFNSLEALAHAFDIITEAEYDAQVAENARQLQALAQEKQAIIAEVCATSQQALTSGEAPNPGSHLPALPSQNTAGKLRNKAFELKKRIQTLKESVEKKHRHIEAQVKAKLAAMMPALDEMNAIVKNLEEVIYQVILYLGRVEEITVLRTGKKAPIETPISIRQTKAYMDEECALDISAGIDAETIKSFDKWLLADPANLDQILPEKKGVVVLEVRRTDKKYHDDSEQMDAATAIAKAVHAAELNRENHKTYWLIRNGENLHRIWTDIVVGDHLIPRDCELDQHFYDSISRQEILPGSEKYYKAMEKANDHARHYMRLALVLQGLIDRTHLFKPHPEGIKRVNLMDPSTWGTLVVAVRDGENKLHDGRPLFDEWLKKINKNAHAGLRIAGAFYRSFHEKVDPRISIRHGAPGKGIFTLIENRGENSETYPFKILFPRGEIWRRGWGGVEKVESTRMASYLISRDDPFICIDHASLEDMNHYLGDRKSRPQYEKMVPLLQVAIALKTEEKDKEAPFIDLLLRKINEAHPNDPCDQLKLERLIYWWKAKVKEHRALTSKDAKAYQMILGEYARQSEDPADRLASVELAKATIARIPDAVAAWYQGRGQFLAAREVPGFPAFATLETWKLKKRVPVKLATEEWVLPQKNAYLRWEEILTTPNWRDRKPTPNPNNHLPPLYDEKLTALALSAETEGQLLALYQNGEKITLVRYFEQSRHAGGDEKEFRRAWKKKSPVENLPLPEIRERLITWKFTKEGPQFRSHKTYGSATYVDHDANGYQLQKGWQRLSDESPAETSENARIIYLNGPLLAQIDAILLEAGAHNHRADAYGDWIRRATTDAEAFLEAIWTKEEKQKYLAENGDPDFFDDHLKTVPTPNIDVDLNRTLLHQIETLGIEAVCNQPFASLRDKDKEKHLNDKQKAHLQALATGGWKTPPFKEDEEI